MKYRWKKESNIDSEESWCLYLILDGKKYEFASIDWYPDIEQWDVFVTGYVSEDMTPPEEQKYDLLCNAKNDVLTYAQVWWVSGVFQRMNTDEKEKWWGMGL